LTSSNGALSYPLDELRSVTSADSGADEFDVHTLDYLGLDDGHRPPPAATISELRHQAQAAITGNLNPSRMRASTVSNPYRLRPSAASSLLSTPAADEDEEYYEGYDDQPGEYGQRTPSYEGADGSYLSSNYVAKGFKPTDHLVGVRPRAISVGHLDDPTRSLQRRAAAAEAAQSSYLSAISVQTQSSLVGAPALSSPASILKSDKPSGSRNGSTASVRFPTGDYTSTRTYLAAPSAQQSRSISPKGDSSQLQAPTRSLWIGNLDSAVTSEQLIHVFAPYGAIESLRLLPEKVCRRILS
jgi:protein JSN1